MTTSTPRIGTTTRRGERGSSLVALMALMTFMALMAMAAAPSLQQQVQRQKEEESIYRGEQVADAIRQYVLITGRLPTSMDQLTDGVPIPGRTSKLQILRAEAAVDPLSSTGEWKMIKSRSPELLDFEKRVRTYNNGVIPQGQYNQIAVLNQEAANITTIVNDPEGDAEEKAPNDEDSTDNSSGPFVGVTSRARRNSIINYYGIGRYDHWVFTPIFR
jgi:type II secretory pathway pseudopilin PulG